MELGQALSRVISMEMVLNMGDKGFRKDLIDNSISTLQKEISALIGHFNFSGQACLIEDYQENS
ncbi:acyl-CoA dehydrogenase, partial [bacterium]|nr:acyl-CoA dehydrogenase [bacterium]